MTESHRNPLALTKWPWLERTGAVNPARFDLRAPAPLQRVIEADDHRPLWGEGLHQ